MPQPRKTAGWSYPAAKKLESWQLESQEHVHLDRERGFGKSVADIERFQPRALELELRARIRGEVRFDDGARALYATDGSNYRQTPIGIVIPRDADDVLTTLEICRRLGAPVLSRGGGTSLAGQCCNVAVILDLSKYMNRVLEIDPDRARARVLPGVILDELRKSAEKFKLTFGPDPATHNHCTLGGMIGNNSCGTHAQMAGRTAENIEELEIVTYDGVRMKVGRTSDQELSKILHEGGRRAEIYRGMLALRDKYGPLIRERYPRIPRRVSGYNLDFLLPENGFDVAKALVGSEGTLVTILEATCRLVDSRPKRALVALGYEDVFHAADHVMEILKFKPIALEGLDEILIENMKKKGLHPEDVQLLPEGGGWLLVEFGAHSQEEADAQARAMMAWVKKLRRCPTMKLFDDPWQEQKVWEVREGGLGATARVPGEPLTWEGWEDSAVPPDQLGSYLRKLKQLYDRYGFKASLYGHFGQGCVHTRIPFDFFTEKGVAQYRSFISDAVDLCVAHGGSLSGEHGDGQSRAEFLPRMFGAELIEAFKEFKSIWDPDWKMNPGKIVHAYSIDQNLRLGSDYSPARVKTYFTYPDDNGFQDATLRCVGIGKCRRMEGGTMCPSFMVTREEKHSTRGRAHLLHEMLTGDVLKGGWGSEAVKDALDLCIACKGCKGDCPVNVDMATYKAEFLAHYYQSHPRPLAALSMGYIDVWARLASGFPELVNFVTQTPILRSFAKRAGGIDPRRKMPRFAERTFKEWFFSRPRFQSERKVILWADTFNNYFHPDTAQAAVEVLEAAGFQVLVPRMHLCCGRPLYDFGILDRARSYLVRLIGAMRSELHRGTAVVVLEPSCYSVFKEELRNLFPHDLDAKRLREQSFLLGDFLKKHAEDFEYPEVSGRALLHGHCHHKAIGKLDAEQEILKKMQLETEVPDSGCCGMAGSFGFEKHNDHYDVSMKMGERVLLPAVRESSRDTLVVADGFSCKTQIAHGTGREALHLAQVIALGLKEKGDRNAK